MVPRITMVDGVEYEVVRMFTEARALINYQGLFVLVDKSDVGWDLSGDPARTPEEKEAIETATADMRDKTVTEVTKE